MPFGCCSKPIKGSFLPKPQRHYLSAQGSHTFALLLITLLEQSSKSYANAKFPSAGSPRTLGAFCFKVFNTPLLAMLQRLRSCACTLCESAEFCSAQGSRTFALLSITPLKQSSKDYANAKFCSAQGSRTFGAFVFDFCCAYFKMVNAFF